MIICALAGVVLSGCGSYGASAHDYATRACDAYRETGRDQVAETKDQAVAIVDLARSNVRAAAAFDPQWRTLSSDMQRAIALMRSHAEDDGGRFFGVDRKVQEDCTDAGRNIGDLEP